MTESTLEEEAVQEVGRAYIYLDGYIKYDARGVPRKRYFAENSREAKACRASLARLLKGDQPLDRQLRDMLAAMFDPEPEPYSIWRDRKLTASFRKKPTDPMASTHVAWFVWEKVKAGAKVDAAVEEAADKFRIDKRQLYRLFARYKPTWELVWGPLDKP